jgi:hypothetical protein
MARSTWWFGDWLIDHFVVVQSNKRTHHVCSRANPVLNQEFQIELRIVEMKGVLTWSLNPYSLSNHPNWKSNGHDQIIMSSRVELLGGGGGGVCVWTCPVSGPQKCDPPTSLRGEYLSMTVLWSKDRNGGWPDKPQGQRPLMWAFICEIFQPLLWWSVIQKKSVKFSSHFCLLSSLNGKLLKKHLATFVVFH